MSRWQIYEVTTDADGVDCYIKRGELVRCKDCKYKYMYKSVWECPYGLMITADGYCNYGERKESE